MPRVGLVVRPVYQVRYPPPVDTNARTAPTGTAPVASSPARRDLLTAEILALGSEIVAGETRDTNSAELARALGDAGVAVLRITALPDRRPAVEEAFRDALRRVDLVISTGGLGPTPDDLTREAIAAVCGEVPFVDPEVEAWLRGLWARRGLAFPELNLKQAWRIASSTTLPNPNGTAPGWWVERPDGRIAVLLPGPPREMRPMWQDEALPRLRARGLGRDHRSRTFRLAGIGESQVADLLGEALLRAENPVVATYARADAVDVRLSAHAEPPATDAHGRPTAARSSEALLDQVEAVVLERLGAFIWSRGETTWAQAIGERLAARGWSLAIREIGTGGAVGTLLGRVDGLRHVESIAAAAEPSSEPVAEARAVGAAGGADVGLAILARVRGADTGVGIGVTTPDGTRGVERVAFLGGEQGRLRAGLAAAHVLLETLDGVGLEPG